MKPDLCIYHAPCQDGFTAAWAIWRRWPEIRFHPGVYGAAPPDELGGLHVLLVDFSFKRPVLEALSRSAATVTVLDHHVSAQRDLEAFAVLNPCTADTIDQLVAQTQPGLGNIRAIFDMDKSGARLAWEFAHRGPAPRLVEHVEDRDLWRFALPDTRAIAADLFSRPYSFAEWTRVYEDLGDPLTRSNIVAGGEAIERKHFKDIGELLGLCTRQMVIGGCSVPVANLPYTMASDAANILAEGQPFAGCYFDRGDGQRQFSLRSREGGLDVSLIAQRYGGGGHARAAGFQVPLGWEGDAP